MANRKKKLKVKKTRKVLAQKPRKSFHNSKKKSSQKKKKTSAASRVPKRARRSNGNFTSRPKTAKRKSKSGSTPAASTKLRINGKFASKKQLQQYEYNKKRREKYQLQKYKEIPKPNLVADKNSIAISEDGTVKHYATADLSGPVEVEVTSQKDRYSEIHAELRNDAISKGRIYLPDAKLRKIDTPFNDGLKQSKVVGMFLTEDTLGQISKIVSIQLDKLAEHQVKGKARFYMSFHMTEYGLETYGSDKGSIATKDGISTDSLHWTAWGTAGMHEPEQTAAMAEAKLREFLKKTSRTTLAIESIDVTMIYERSGE